MSKTVALDIETDDLNATRIWVICGEDVDTHEKVQFLNVDTIPEQRDAFVAYVNSADKLVLHNGIGFDVPVLNRLLGPVVDPHKVIDTLIVSRLVDYDIKGGHSLKAWGQRLGDYKLDFKAFDMLTQEMVDYCHQDVTVTVKLYSRLKKHINDPQLQDALRCEHEIQMLCEEMTGNGFYFDKDRAEVLLSEIKARMAELEADFQKDFPPKLEEVNRLSYRVNKEGNPYATVIKAREKYALTKIDVSVKPNQLVCYDFIPFNPASPKMRIDRLWDAGWKPFEKTKGHIEYEREQRRRSW
jgi:DNA polymerase-1